MSELPLFAPYVPQERHLSSDEWFTPIDIIEAARRAMGTIDLDPASCAEANLTVKASRIYTKEQDGLRWPWAGSVFVNPPYSNTGDWVEKLFIEWRAGRLVQAIVVVNANPDTAWCQLLLDWPVCFVRGRLRFRRPAAEEQKIQPRWPSAIFYIGKNSRSFYREFNIFGKILTLAKESEME